MKCVLILLSVILLYVEGVPSPQYSISWSSQPKGIDRSNVNDRRDRGREWGSWSNEGKQGNDKREGNEGWRGNDRQENDGWRNNEGRQQNDRREDSDRHRERIDDSNRGFRNEDNRRDDDYFPRIIGRQGLGYEKRNYRSLAMRFPITPEILQPIGYRKTLKDLYFVPLPRY